jgi:hypothetical protein
MIPFPNKCDGMPRLTKMSCLVVNQPGSEGSQSTRTPLPAAETKQKAYPAETPVNRCTSVAGQAQIWGSARGFARIAGEHCAHPSVDTDLISPNPPV